MRTHHPIAEATTQASRWVGGLWRVGATVHRVLRARRRPQVAPPLLVVGSLRAGGSRKTDLVSWIAARHSHLAILVHPTGDEDRMLASRFPGRVFCHRDWLEAWKIAEGAGFSVGICDGGLQDPALDGCPAVQLVHPEGPRGTSDLLPFGAFRELRSHRRDRPCLLALGSDLLGTPNPRDLPPPGTEVSAACAVARPEVFFRDLESAGLVVVERVSLPDHARFPGWLLARMEAATRPWLVTEKDAWRQDLPGTAKAVRRALELNSSSVEELDRLVGRLRWRSAQSGVLEAAPLTSRTRRGTR